MNFFFFKKKQNREKKDETSFVADQHDTHENRASSRDYFGDKAKAQDPLPSNIGCCAPRHQGMPCGYSSLVCGQSQERDFICASSQNGLCSLQKCQHTVLKQPAYKNDPQREVCERCPNVQVWICCHCKNHRATQSHNHNCPHERAGCSRGDCDFAQGQISEEMQVFHRTHPCRNPNCNLRNSEGLSSNTHFDHSMSANHPESTCYRTSSYQYPRASAEQRNALQHVTTHVPNNINTIEYGGTVCHSDTNACPREKRCTTSQAAYCPSSRLMKMATVHHVPTQPYLVSYNSVSRQSQAVPIVMPLHSVAKKGSPLQIQGCTLY